MASYPRIPSGTVERFTTSLCILRATSILSGDDTPMVSEFPMLIDSHAHLDARQFNDDQDAMLHRAAAAGVRAVVNVGYNAATWPTTRALAAAHPGIFACLG